MHRILNAALLALFALQTVAMATSPAPSRHRPNLDLSIYRRTFTTDEPVAFNLSTFNLRAVSFTVHRLDLDAFVPTSGVVDDLGKRVAAVDLARAPVVRSFGYRVPSSYPDDWTQNEVKAPRLGPGAYLIDAHADGVEKRTWFIVSDVALVSKRSRDTLLVWTVDPRSGAPIVGARLLTTDRTGAHDNAMTGRDGTCAIPAAPGAGPLWIRADWRGEPAVLLSSAPDAPPPYTVYTQTDRPVYRPANTVDYKAVVRARIPADAPGGFRYENYAEKPVTIEIRDSTDALIARKTLTTNAYGSVTGSIALASEPVLGDWQIVTIVPDGHDGYRSYATFTVEAYRKPEFMVNVTSDRPHYLGGDTAAFKIEAKYYAGQPVTGAAVHYNIGFDTTGDNNSSDNTIEPDYSGDAVTDSHGDVLLKIKTQRHPYDRTVTVDATVTDLSRRALSGSGSAQITAGAFTLSLSTDKEVYQPGDRVDATVNAADYDNHPVRSKVRVTLTEMKYDNQHRAYKETTVRDVQTGANGIGETSFVVQRPGDLDLDAVAYDGDDDKIEDSSDIWVCGGDDANYNYPTVGLVADRDSYRPGDTATLILNTDLITPKDAPVPPTPKGQAPPPRYFEGWALITVEGEKLYRQFVVELPSRTTSFKVPLTDRCFPSVSVSASIVQGRQIYTAEQTLTVRRDEQKLAVTVTPDKTAYQPGDTATYTVTTRDDHGRPVPAEVALGVVDSSIYAVKADSTPQIESYFYPDQQVRIQTDFSFAAQYSGGGYQTMARMAPAVPPKSPAGIRVRRNFADTALWSPTVATDSSGTTTVSVTLPDNLTAWRSTARGITLGTAVGQTTNEVTSSMPLMVRLEQPRFYVAGDKTTLSAVVQNATAEQKTVSVRVSAAGAMLDGGSKMLANDPQPGGQVPSVLTTSVVLAAGAEQRLDWPATIGAGPNVVVDVTADGGPGAQDAVESTLDVLPDGLPRYEAQSYTLTAGSDSRTVDLSSLPAGASVTVTLSPTLASSMLDAAKDLAAYPYGCAEQTVSGLLPDIYVARALDTTGRSHDAVPHLDDWVSLALQKLYRYQHGDGGWQWWEDDPSDPDMTAYVLWALIQARHAGYVVDDQRIARGTACLTAYLKGERDPSRRAEWLETLAWADPSAAAGPLMKLYAKRDKLDVVGLASLCIGLSQCGGGPAQRADEVAKELRDQAITRSGFVHWSADVGGYGWETDDVYVTAHVLRALLAAPTSVGGNYDYRLRPQEAPATHHDETVMGAVRWLMSERTGKAWSTTRASAEAVYAITSAMMENGETSPNFTAGIAVGGRNVADYTATPQTPAGDTQVTVLTPAELAGATSLTITKHGTGVLYATVATSWTDPPDVAAAHAGGISVTPTYTITTPDPSEGGSIASGTDVDVHLDIDADQDCPYAMVEAPVPAGCEVGGSDDDTWQTWSPAVYSRREARDDKVVFFFDKLPKGHTSVEYSLHAETPGSYRILAALASMVYHPEIRGNTALARANIHDASGATP